MIGVNFCGDDVLSSSESQVGLHLLTTLAHKGAGRSRDNAGHPMKEVQHHIPSIGCKAPSTKQGFVSTIQEHRESRR